MTFQEFDKKLQAVVKLQKYKKVNEQSNKVYVFTAKELKNQSPFNFKSGDEIYVKPNKNADYKYIIELKKEKYRTFSLESRVMNAKNYKYLDCTVGNRPGMTPQFIDDFLHKEK